MSPVVNGFAAERAGAPLQPFQYEMGPLDPSQVEISVEFCGLCHSDLSMLDNEWRSTTYPFVPGHEVIGRIAALGDHVSGLELGQRVGLGWTAQSCMHCQPCVGGEQHLCGQAEATIVGRHGGFADRVRCHWLWALPLPENLDPARAGPLFCGGLTVFSPMLKLGVLPTHRVAVVGLGGLGHLAVQFLARWGCEVTVFSSSEAKAADARGLGAHAVVSSRDKDAIKRITGRFDLILVTVNATLDWSLYLRALRPQGRLHFVGAVLEPIPVSAFGLIGGEKSLSGSPTGSPSTLASLLEFSARHGILPVTETFPMTKVNDALERLRSNQARYRIVLAN